MVRYYDFDKVLWDIINEGKNKSGIDHLGLRIREFKTNKSEINHNNLEERFYLMYYGEDDIENDSLEKSWEKRLVYVPLSLDGITLKELREDIINQIQSGVFERFQSDINLDIFALSLE